MKEKRSFFERLTGAIRIPEETEEEETGSVGLRVNGGRGGAGGTNASGEITEEVDTGDGELMIDVYQTPTDIVIKTMVPGVRPEDLETANTLVFVPGKGVVLNEPSVVAVSEQDNKILAVGVEAKNMIGRTPDSIIAYRPMKDGVIADYRVTEAMLRYFIDKALGRWNIWKPDVMISVPAGVTSTERRAVIEAAIKAGAKNAYVVKEPILAAIGAGIPIQEAMGHMVVDIGGGTTDVAVISLGGIVSSTSVKVAGNKIDSAIADYIKKTFNLGIGDKMAEDIKIKIGSAVPLEEEYSLTIRGRDFITGLPRTAEVRTNEIVKAIGKLCNIICFHSVHKCALCNTFCSHTNSNKVFYYMSRLLPYLCMCFFRKFSKLKHISKDSNFSSGNIHVMD
jgi:rod shape-determining protein MreB